MLCFVSSALIAQEVDHLNPVRPYNYDKNGYLETTDAQQNRDREAGILQRGGYDPQAAAVQAARAAAQNKPVPKLGNTSSSQPSSRSLSARSIYRCKNGKTEVYADDDNKYKFQQCQLIRRGYVEIQEEERAKEAEKLAAEVVIPGENTAPADPALLPVEEQPLPSPCSGAILYQGSTYIFSENEPCPIPADVFLSRRPIEAEAQYYAPQAPVGNESLLTE